MKLGLVVVLSLVHVMQGCHTWQLSNGKTMPATTTISVQRGARVQVHITCPMDFVVNGQLWHTGTTHTLTFPKPGTFVFTAVNVQTPEEAGLQTLGSTNVPKLIVRVR
ncbi:MAG: hypothetical protein ABUS54_13930 [Actinomycetota bacterium]